MVAPVGYDWEWEGVTQYSKSRYSEHVLGTYFRYLLSSTRIREGVSGGKGPKLHRYRNNSVFA